MTPKLYVALALAALLAALGFGVHHYRGLYKAAEADLRTLQGKVQERNDEAATKLRTMTAERDALQAALDKKREDQEKKDDATKLELERLARAADAVPTVIRVRVPATCPAGRGGDSGPGGAPAAAVPGAVDAGTTSGVLAPEADRRFKRSVEDIESLQAAFNSCKDSSR